MIIGLMGNMGVGKDTFADRLVQKHDFVKVALADPLKRICKEVYDFSDEQLWGPSSERNKPDPRYLHRKKGSNGHEDMRAFVNKETGKVDFTGTVYAGLEDCVEYPEYKGHKLANLPSPPRDEYLTPRMALQLLGTEWGRHCYQNTWTSYALRAASLILDEGYDYDQKMGPHSQAFDSSFYNYAGVVIPDVRFRNEVDAIIEKGGIVIRLVREWGEVKLHGIQGHASETEQASVPDELVTRFQIPEGIGPYHEAIDTFAERILEQA